MPAVRPCPPGLAITLAAALSTASAASAASAANAASAAGAGAPAGQPGRLLSSLALGLNTAPWDYIYAADASAGGGVDIIQPLLQAADIGLLRYGGGSYADYYDWQTNTDIQTCIWGNPFGSFTGAPFPYDTTAPFTGASCDNTDSLPFDQFSAQAKAIGAQSFVTVNYGSGTPAEAAAWVSHSRSTPGDSVALWEVGNENYGCWEVNNWLAQAAGELPGLQAQRLHDRQRRLREPDVPPGDPGRRPGHPDARDLLRRQRPPVHGCDEAG